MTKNKAWADAEFDAVASGFGDAKQHIRNLYDHWDEVKQHYAITDRLGRQQQLGVGEVFVQKYPNVFSKTHVQKVGQAHRLRAMLTMGSQTATPSDISDDTLVGAFGDPAVLTPEDVVAAYKAAKVIGERRNQERIDKGLPPRTYTVIKDDVKEAQLGYRPASSSGSLSYWPEVLHKMTTMHAGLDVAMCDRIIDTAEWCKKELSDA